MATIVFSNTGDVDTRVLAALWDGIPDARVLDIRPGTPDARRAVDEAISEEEDALVLCGHGSPQGLFDPSVMAGRIDLSALLRNPPFLVDARNAPSIRARRTVGVWCYAAEFAASANLPGFFTGMFVSNPGEAAYVRCPTSDARTITGQEVLFCRRVNELLRSDVPMEDWIPRLNAQADRSIGVVRYNYDRLRFRPRA
jgi:hypothetical protein